MENMVLKRITAFSHKTTIEEFEKNIISSPIENKEKILAYLRKFDDFAFTSQPVYDIYTGEKVGEADNAVTDGVYTWYHGDIYHFEKYNLKLSDDFLEYLTPQI